MSAFHLSNHALLPLHSFDCLSFSLRLSFQASCEAPLSRALPLALVPGLAYTKLCTVAAGFVPPSPIPCSLAIPPPLGLPSAPFPRDGGQGVEPVCMQSVGSVQPAQVFFLKVRRRKSSKSVGRCSILGEGTGRYGGKKIGRPGPARAE